MAIIKVGSLISDIKGLVGGLIFARNKGGLYVKNFATPINPQTTRQTDVRNDFATLVDDWQSRLIGLERTAWNDYGENNPVLNRLGELINISGLNWFIKLNALRLQASLTVVDDPPIGSSTGVPDTTLSVDDIDLGGASIDVGFNVALNWVGTDGDAMAVFAPAIQGQGIETFKRTLRFVGIIAGNTALPPTSPATLAYPWDGPTGGGKVFVEAVILETSPLKQTEGSRSPYFNT